MTNSLALPAWANAEVLRVLGTLIAASIVGLTTYYARQRFRKHAERRQLASDLEAALMRFSDADMRDWPPARRDFAIFLRTWRVPAGRSFPRGPAIAKVCEDILTCIEVDATDDRSVSTSTPDIGGFLRVRAAALDLYQLACEDAKIDPRELSSRAERHHVERIRRGRSTSRISGRCPHCHSLFECYQTADLAETREVLCDRCQTRFPISAILDD